MIIPRKALLTAPLLIVALFVAGCPSQKDLDRMASASRELAHDVVTAEKVVGALYTSGKISKARKDSYADKLRDVAVKGKAFNDVLIDLDKKYPQGTIPPDLAQTLHAEFAPLSALISSIISDLTSDGAKKGDTKLGDHAKTINEVLNK